MLRARPRPKHSADSNDMPTGISGVKLASCVTDGAMTAERCDHDHLVLCVCVVAKSNPRHLVQRHRDTSVKPLHCEAMLGC